MLRGWTLGLILWIAVLAIMLSSCATYTKEYHNEEGRTFTCEVEGPLSYGIIVHSMLERCKARALAAGYK